MKFVKKLLLILVIILAIVLIVAAFLPANVKIARSIEINKPVEAVYGNLITYQNRMSWDPWLERDPKANVTVSSDSGVGAQYSWESPELGAGNMEIKEVVPNKMIKSKLHFLRPQISEADITWELESIANATKTTWIFESKMSYPVERIFGLFFKRMLGPDLEKGLDNLKKVIEQQ